MYLKIKVHDLWQYIGFTIKVTDIQDVPDGNYIVLAKEDYGIEIGNLHTRTTELIEEWDEDTEVTLTSDTVDLLELDRFKLAHLIQLASDGWVMDTNSRYHNITPRINEYRVIVELLGLHNKIT